MRSIVSLSVLALATGCLTATPTTHSTIAPPALQAWIGFPPGSSPDFPIYLNRSAYVALFEIIPNRGVTLLYPQTERFAYAHDVHYVSMTIQPGRMLYTDATFANYSLQPRYYYLVASELPLNLARLQESLGGIRRVLGKHYLAHRPFDVIDRLTSYVVPRQPDEHWATDLLVDWPAPPPPRLAIHYVQCANGRILAVHASYPFFGCPGDPRVTTMAPVAHRDSTTRQPLPGTGERPRLPEVRDAGKRVADAGAPAEITRRRAEARARPPVDHPGMRRVRASDDARASSPHRPPDDYERKRPTPAQTTADRSSTERSATPARTTSDAPTRTPDPPREQAPGGKERKPQPDT